MPVQKPSEAHRALELLEQYHAVLNRPSDADLKFAIEKVISIFKASLFSALCDIQSFYDNTLLNERVSLTQKTYETRQLAQRWENNPPFGTLGVGGGAGGGGGGLLGGGSASRYLSGGHIREPSGEPYTNGGDKVTTAHSYSYQEQSRQLTKDGWATSEYNTRTVDGPQGFHTQTTSASGLIDEQGREWEVEDVVLEKNQTGLGFSISGGRDRTNEPDNYIRVTDISQGGAVARDGRIRVGDVILKVNNTDCTEVQHQVAVDALKSSGSVVRLLVKRLKPTPDRSFSSSSRPAPAPLVPAHLSSPSGLSTTGFPSQPSPEILRLEQIPGVKKLELVKTIGPDGRPRNLGLSVAGGIGNEHYPNDTGVFVTGIIEGSPAYYSGRIHRGDQILAVDNTVLENVTNKFAVDTLRSTGNRVSLLFITNPHADFEDKVRLDDSAASRSLQGFATSTGTLEPTIGALSGSQGHLSYGQQPYIPSSQQQQQLPEIGGEQRVVTLRKSEGGLGFNIVGGEDREPIYVSHILPGGVADLSGSVRRGDVLLRVNDTNLNNATHNEAALALKACPPNSYVQLLLQYCPLEYQQFEERVERLRNDLISKQHQQQQQQFPPQPIPIPISTPSSAGGGAPPPRRDLYVRALFDNDPSRDAGVPHRSLTFRYGDVLHVLNAADDDWWTARRVAENGDEGPEGVIPSKKRVEKRERQRRKQVNFNAGSQSLGRNTTMGAATGGFGSTDGGGGGLEGRRGSRSQLSFSRRFPFFKSHERLNEFSEGELGSGGIGGGGGSVEEPIFSYETVEPQSIGYVRPVIILGALKDRINDELVSRNPDRFSSCVPHTSRPPRENEINGRDYNFVTKAEMERDVKNNLFIEAGQFQNNLYGTSIAAVREVANSGRHCILDVSGNAIRRLQNSANIHPIAIFVKPFNHHQLQEWDPQLSEDEAIKQYERCQRQEQSFGDLFTAIITGHSAEDVLARVVHTIGEQSRPRIWIPTRQPLY